MNSFINSFTFHIAQTASSFEQTTAICQTSIESSISTSKTSLKAIFIRVFLAKVKVELISLRFFLSFVISSTVNQLFVVNHTDFASFILILRFSSISFFLLLDTAIFRVLNSKC